MPAMSARPFLPISYYGQGNQFPFVPNPNLMFSEREQMLHQQLIQERQQFEAWRASQPQPQPPISLSGPVQVGGNVEIIKERSASTSTKRARPEDQVSVKGKEQSFFSNNFIVLNHIQVCFITIYDGCLT